MSTPSSRDSTQEHVSIKIDGGSMESDTTAIHVLGCCGTAFERKSYGNYNLRLRSYPNKAASQQKGFPHLPGRAECDVRTRPSTCNATCTGFKNTGSQCDWTGQRHAAHDMLGEASKRLAKHIARGSISDIKVKFIDTMIPMTVVKGKVYHHLAFLVRCSDLNDPL